MKLRYTAITLFILIAVSACKKFKIDIDEELITRNFRVIMDENPEEGFEIGEVYASSTYGRIEFKLDRQYPEGAVEVSSDDGIVKVADPSKFDYETDSVITGTVIVSNPRNTDSLKLNIKLRDLDD